MLRDQIYVIHSDSKIESLYTLFPLIISRFNHLLVYVNVDSKEAMMVSGRCAILIRVFKGNKLYEDNVQKKRKFIEDFRKRFDRVVILDDGAGSDSLHYEYMDLVDLYYKGKLLRDRSNYLRPMYGRQLFTDYYHQTFGVDDDKMKIRSEPPNADLINKLRISWNLGYGIYPIPGKRLVSVIRGITKLGLSRSLRPWFIHCYKKMIDTLNKPSELSNKLIKVQARFGNSSLPHTIGYQRNLFLEKCAGNPYILSGSVNEKFYNKEIKQVAAVLSPFGWGEVCFRDFETIMNGGLLIKPDMSHLETWPDVYIPSKTYIPVAWDGNNLADTINDVANNTASYYAIAANGKKAYREAFLQLDKKIFEVLTEASGINVEYDSFYADNNAKAQLNGTTY